MKMADRVLAFVLFMGGVAIPLGAVQAAPDGSGPIGQMVDVTQIVGEAVQGSSASLADSLTGVAGTQVHDRIGKALESTEMTGRWGKATSLRQLKRFTSMLRAISWLCGKSEFSAWLRQNKIGLNDLIAFYEWYRRNRVLASHDLIAAYEFYRELLAVPPVELEPIIIQDPIIEKPVLDPIRADVQSATDPFDEPPLHVGTEGDEGERASVRNKGFQGVKGIQVFRQ